MYKRHLLRALSMFSWHFLPILKYQIKNSAECRRTKWREKGKESFNTPRCVRIIVV